MSKKKKEEKIIYCWKCGLGNPSKNRYCKDKKCHAKLKKQEHPIFSWLFGEVKENTEENLIGTICDLLVRFFKLHLYGVTVGLAFAFSVAATIFHFDTSREATVTDNEYFLPQIVEKEEQKEEKKTPTLEKVETKEKETKQESKQETKPATTTPKETKYDCYVDEDWNGTYVGNGICERIITPLAQKSYSCPTGYSLNGTNCVGNEDVESAIRYYCASTVEEYTQSYGEPPCGDHTDLIIQSTLHSEEGTCDYKLIDPETMEAAAGCFIFPGYRAIQKQGRYCSSSDLQPWGDYCRRVIPATITYTCNSGELVGDRCRTIQRYYGRKLS